VKQEAGAGVASGLGHGVPGAASPVAGEVSGPVNAQALLECHYRYIASLSVYASMPYDTYFVKATTERVGGYQDYNADRAIVKHGCILKIHLLFIEEKE
jgi:hypothetical protein